MVGECRHLNRRYPGRGVENLGLEQSHRGNVGVFSLLPARRTEPHSQKILECRARIKQRLVAVAGVLDLFKATAQQTGEVCPGMSDELHPFLLNKGIHRLDLSLIHISEPTRLLSIS